MLVVVSTGLSIVIPTSLKLVFTSFNLRLRLVGAPGHNLLLFVFIYRESATSSNSFSNSVAVPIHPILDSINLIILVTTGLASSACSV